MIVPGTPEAIAYIARRMRAADSREIFALRSSDDLNLLISDMLQFQTSVAMRDGRPVAVVGCRELVEAPWIWSFGGFGTDEWPRVKFSLTKFIVQEMIPAMFSCGAQRVVCHVAAWRADTLRWMDRIGGQRGNEMPAHGRDGSAYIPVEMSAADYARKHNGRKDRRKSQGRSREQEGGGLSGGA